eukprot:2361225-Rhodomonas_salina.1
MDTEYSDPHRIPNAEIPNVDISNGSSNASIGIAHVWYWGFLPRFELETTTGTGEFTLIRGNATTWFYKSGPVGTNH